jgi:hypothetical protein
MFTLLAALLVLGLLAHAFVWNINRRAAMTPEQRDAEDAEDRWDSNIW